MYETVVPKLVAEDIPLLQSLLSDVFPGVKYVGAEMRKLKEEVKKVCAEMHFVYGEGEEQGGAWVDKVGWFALFSKALSSEAWDTFLWKWNQFLYLTISLIL